MTGTTERYEVRRGQFGWALEEMRRGRRLRRFDWDDKTTWVCFVGYASSTTATFEGIHWEDYIAMKTPTNTVVPWTPTQTDILAEDWEHADADD